MIVLLFFILPRNYDWVTFFSVPSDKLPRRPSESLLTWEFVHERMEWGILILLGGGFALSEGGQRSGLNSIIGNYFKTFEGMSPFTMVVVNTLIVQAATELTSNMTIASIVLPVFAEMVERLLG